MINKNGGQKSDLGFIRLISDFALDSISLFYFFLNKAFGLIRLIFSFLHMYLETLNLRSINARRTKAINTYYPQIT